MAWVLPPCRVNAPCLTSHAPLLPLMFRRCSSGPQLTLIHMCPAGDSQGLYKGVVDCFVKTFKNDGPMAFYKGFVPNFGRLGSWNVAMFMTLEQVKSYVSKYS